MANYTVNSGTHALVQNTEYSVAQSANFSSGSPKTSTGRVHVWLDLRTAVGSSAGPVAGDAIQFRFYRSIGGGTLVADEVVTLPLGSWWNRDLGLIGGNWEATVTLTTATGRTIGYEVTQDTNDVNAATAGATAVSSIQSGLALAATALSNATWTNGRAGNLDNLDAVVSGRAPSSTALSTATWTSGRAAALDNADVATSTRASSTAIASVQTDTTAALARIPAALVGGRISADVGSWLGTAAATPTVAGIPKVEDATLQARMTSGRALALDSIDATVSSRASATALASVQTDATTLLGRLTSTRAGRLDNIDAAISTLATSSAATAIASAVANIQTRLPVALVGGNMAVNVQVIADGAITAAAAAAGYLTAVAASVLASTIDTAVDFTSAPITISLLGATRLMLSAAIGKLSGAAGVTAGTPTFRDPSDAKDRIRATTTTSGRTLVKVDPT